MTHDILSVTLTEIIICYQEFKNLRISLHTQKISNDIFNFIFNTNGHQ